MIFLSKDAREVGVHYLLLSLQRLEPPPLHHAIQVKSIVRLMRNVFHLIRSVTIDTIAVTVKMKENVVRLYISHLFYKINLLLGFLKMC